MFLELSIANEDENEEIRNCALDQSMEEHKLTQNYGNAAKKIM